jgi:hypothetical protein
MLGAAAAPAAAKQDNVGNEVHDNMARDTYPVTTTTWVMG